MPKYKQHASLPVNFEGFMNARQPQDVFTFFDDFMGCTWGIDADSDALTTSKTVSTWDYTAIVGGATMACVDADDLYDSTLGGALRITTVASADDGGNLQVSGTQFLVQQNTMLPLYFEARFRSSDVSNTDFCIGLSHVDGEMVKNGPNDFIGFNFEEATLTCMCAKDSNEKTFASGVTMADGAAGSNAGWIRAAFFFDGRDTIVFMIDSNDDGEFDYVATFTVSTAAHYVPTDEALTPTIEAITGTTASAGVLDIDYVYVCQQRYHA